MVGVKKHLHESTFNENEVYLGYGIFVETEI